MSGKSDDHASVVNSTLTELVLILLFGFMLVAAHFGSKARTIGEKAAQAIDEKNGRIEALEGKLAAGTNNPPPKPQPPLFSEKLIDKSSPPCLVKQEGTRHGMFLLITTKVEGERLSVRINNDYEKYQPGRSALNLSPQTVDALRSPKSYGLDDLYRLASSLKGMVKDGRRCNINLSLPHGSSLPGTMHEKLSDIFTLGYFTPGKP